MDEEIKQIDDIVNFGTTLGGKIPGPVGKVVGAAGTGWKIGRKLDETFGISDKIVGVESNYDSAPDWVKKVRAEQARHKAELQASPAQQAEPFNHYAE